MTDHAAHSEHEGHSVGDFRKRFWVSLAITVPILFLSDTIRSFVGLAPIGRVGATTFVLLGLSTVLYVYGGRPFLVGCVRELRHGQPGMMTLIAMAITTAFAYSTAVTFGLAGMDFFWELATLIDIMLVGHWIEMRSVLGASNALEKLVKLLPATAHLVSANGEIVDIPLSELKVGAPILIKPGEKIPADGSVSDGISSVNEALVTGESKPVTKRANDRVIGGSINGEGSLTVVVKSTGADSFLAKVIELVRVAQQTRSRTQDLANRAARWLTIIALLASAVAFVAWFVFAGSSLAFAIERAVTVLVISCPHALGLAIPLVVSVSTAIAARNGLLIRDRSAFESARSVQAVVFDKTGTLTAGTFGITDVLAFGTSMSADDIVDHAAAVERFSEHPIAKAIAEHSLHRLPADGFRALPGVGAQASVAGKLVQVVSPGFVANAGLRFDEQRIALLAEQGKTVVFILVDSELVGAMALADVVREQSRTTIAGLKQAGIRTIMLTGDNKKVAAWVAEQVGVDEYVAEVLPHQKVEKIKEIQSRGLTVAMVGDGINDAPALAGADIGIAIGAGTDVAAETADIILVRSDPSDVLALVTLARRTYRKMEQNLLWATGYNAVAIPLAAGVLAAFGIILSPAVGAILMSVSTVVVAINSRLLRLEHSHA